MRALKLTGLAVAFLFAVTLCVRAAEKEDKEVTLKGTITCAKCDLKLEGVKDCATVIQVKDGDKTITYFFDADSSKAAMKEICKAAKKGSVKGTVAEKDGKKTITVSKDGVTFDK
jgi:hypothetical protein